MRKKVAMVKGGKVVELTTEGRSCRLTWGISENIHSQSFNPDAAEKWFNDLVELLESSGKEVVISEIEP